MKEMNSKTRQNAKVLSGVLLMLSTVAAWTQTPAPGTEAKPSTTIPVVMTMAAGSAHWKPYPGADKTMHSGIGHISPFGTASYSCGFGFPEQKTVPKPDYFNATWQATYGTALFCVYTVPQGKIYVWDGIVGSLIPKSDAENKSDYLINVIVGGTGIFEGASGMLLGRTVGAGAMKEVAPKETLPRQFSSCWMDTSRSPKI